jgi:DNA-binding MarR family transcriptional regulator
MNRFMRQVMMMERQEKLCWGVTLSQHYVIDALYRKHVLTMNSLSEEVGLAVSTLTRVVDVLVRDDVIARKHSEEDRRKVCIELTGKGKKLAENLRDCAERFWGAVLEELPDAQKKAIAENLRMLLTAMDKIGDAHCPKARAKIRKTSKRERNEISGETKTT